MKSKPMKSKPEQPPTQEQEEEAEFQSWFDNLCRDIPLPTASEIEAGVKEAGIPYYKNLNTKRKSEANMLGGYLRYFYNVNMCTLIDEARDISRDIKTNIDAIEQILGRWKLLKVGSNKRDTISLDAVMLGSIYDQKILHFRRDCIQECIQRREEQDKIQREREKEKSKEKIIMYEWSKGKIEEAELKAADAIFQLAALKSFNLLQGSEYIDPIKLGYDCLVEYYDNSKHEVNMAYNSYFESFRQSVIGGGSFPPPQPKF